MSYDVTITLDNSDLFGERKDKAILRALEKIGLTAEGYAKQEVPVDTGRLRNSITHQVINDEKATIIGTNVEYAIYVELGTSRQKAQPYLLPAAENHVDQYRDILKKELENG